MLNWFRQWKQEQEYWPFLPASSFQLRGPAMTIIKDRVVSVTTRIDMGQGEKQTLWVLTTLQYLAEVGPKDPPPGHITHCVQSIMRPLQQAEISFHLMLYLGMPPQLTPEALLLKQTSLVLISPCCPPVYVQLGTCLDQIISFDSVLTNQPSRK